MPQRIKCVDDRCLLVADHSHFLEIDANGGHIFRDIADVLVLGAAPITTSAAVTPLQKRTSCRLLLAGLRQLRGGGRLKKFTTVGTPGAAAPKFSKMLRLQLESS
jgi:hypothetical protein